MNGEVIIIASLDNDFVLPEGAVWLFSKTKSIASLLVRQQELVDMVNLCISDQLFAGEMASTLWGEGTSCYEAFQFYQESAGINPFIHCSGALGSLSDMQLDSLRDMHACWEQSQDLFSSSNYWRNLETEAANAVMVNQRQAVVVGAIIADARHYGGVAPAA
mgnify:CR=1 FL=1